MKKSWFMAPLVVISKWAKLAKVFKLLKLLKFGKVFIMFFTMVLSAVIYAFWLGPWFSVGFVLMLFIHEMGHVMAMRIKGMPTSIPVFIPMLGAVIFSPSFKSREDEAFVGYAGPLVGGAAALALFGIWAFLPRPSEILLLISYTAAFINLFNLIPIRPLDGGRTTQIIGGWFKYFGIAGLLLLTLYIREPGILLIWILILDDINLEPWLKFGTGIICQLSMMFLMAVGLSSQVWWVNMIDIALASLFNFTYFGDFRWGLDETINEVTIIEPVIMSVRVRWFVLYFTLVVALITLMLFQAPYLPHPVQQHATIS